MKPNTTGNQDMHEQFNLPTEFQVALEAQETAYWREYYQDVPEGLARRMGLGLATVGTAVAVAASGIDILAFNRVIGLGIERPASEREVNEIVAFYRNAGTGRFFIQLSPHAMPRRLAEVLLAKGFRHHNNWVKFYREIEPLPVADTSLRIEAIGPERAGILAKILVGGFEWPEALAPLLALPVGRPGWRHYLAYQGEKPVAAAALFVRGEYATLAFAATLAESRGLGAQSALIARRFRDAAAAGCRWMFTETAEETAQRPVASYRNMLRRGFRLAYRRPNYLWVAG